jgi:hypothetical protein
VLDLYQWRFFAADLFARLDIADHVDCFRLFRFPVIVYAQPFRLEDGFRRRGDESPSADPEPIGISSS